ncbi:MAG: type II toxin-antitoxin system PemK/MazF family toxin [Myxacorys chilensis ATA2-1-KO14]|jgi:mRNA interferase MazF|nr:type II toxin-antitoxin system PemK/MazF family toxin [Myxacorys chilensis ATA2-1-KO14]
MTLSKGDIVLVEFPFTDLSQTKLRPALLLTVDFRKDEITLCFISSQQLEDIVDGEFAIYASDPEFLTTGLKVASKIRVTRMVTLQRRQMLRYLGKLGIHQTEIFNERLRRVFQLNDQNASV